MDLIRAMALMGALGMSLWVDTGDDGEEAPSDPLAAPTPSEPVEIPSWNGLIDV